MMENPFIKKIINKKNAIGLAATLSVLHPSGAKSQNENTPTSASNPDKITLATNQTEPSALSTNATAGPEEKSETSATTLYDFNDFLKKQNTGYLDSLNVYYKTGNEKIKPVRPYKYLDPSRYVIEYCDDCRSYKVNDPSGNLVKDFQTPEEAYKYLQDDILSTLTKAN